MSKSSKPSKKQLRNSLLDALFDPRDSGPAAAVLELQDPKYLEMKAREELLQLHLYEKEMLLSGRAGAENYARTLTRCLQLLALAKLLRLAPYREAKEAKVHRDPSGRLTT